MRFMLFAGIGVYTLIVVAPFFLPTLPTATADIALFRVLSPPVATPLGGIQALSRSSYGRLIPAQRSAEFFGFDSIFGNFPAITGPSPMGAATQITRRSNVGVLSLTLLFAAGAVVLTPVEEESATRGYQGRTFRGNLDAPRDDREIASGIKDAQREATS